GTKRKSKKGKEASGASRNVEADGVNQTQVLPTQDAGDQRDQNQEHEAETSHTDERVGLNTAGGGDDVETGSKGEVAEPSMREVLEAVKLMGAHMVTLTQAFTPLVNSSVGQVTP
ncbi:unnamed protein product, partial [Brassica rapa]